VNQPSEKPSAYIARDRRRALAQRENLPDRTHGAALFADISGFTPLTEALARSLGVQRGAEELTRQLNTVYDALIHEVDRHGGSVIVFGGDAITCWFDGDQGARAAACGLAMQQVMRRFASIPLHGGETASLALKVAVASGPARRFQVGDPAIQVMDVLAGATLQRMAEAELTELMEALAATAGGAGRIVRIEGAPGVGKSHLAAELIERALEQGFRVALGACQSTTRDIAYMPWRQAFRALLGLDDAAGTAMDVVVERHVAAVEAYAAGANPDWLLRLPLLGDLLGLPIPDNTTTAAFDPNLRRNALIDLAVEIAQHEALARPLLLLIDDAHWMDEASRGLTVALGRAIERSPLTLALTHRPPVEDQAILPELEALPWHHNLALNELTPASVGALLAQRLDGAPTPLVLDVIQADAQGNPFFTEELVESLRESGRLERHADGRWYFSEATFTALRGAGLLVRAEGEWALAPQASPSSADLGLPGTVEGMVQARLDRLPAEAKLMLKVASVVGRTFSLDVLARAHPLRPTPAALAAQLETLLARDFARLETPPPHASYLFKHNVTHQVAYDTLLFAQRRELHGAMALALEDIAPDAVPQLARHSYLGEDWPRALRYELEAGRQAERLFAAHEGIEHLQKALHSAARLPSAGIAAQRQEIYSTPNVQLF